MSSFLNKDGKSILLAMVKSIQENKQYLSDLDGLIGDGDHGMNMNKGFTMFKTRFADKDISFTEGLNELGMILLNEIGGSMGPIYGTIFMEMHDAAEDEAVIDLPVFCNMLKAGMAGLFDIVEARVGDKTLIDTLSPSVDALRKAIDDKEDFKTALENMKTAAAAGRDSTEELIARYGRASRLGERSRGVLDCGAASCEIILRAMADQILRLL